MDELSLDELSLDKLMVYGSKGRGVDHPKNSELKKSPRYEAKIAVRIFLWYQNRGQGASGMYQTLPEFSQPLHSIPQTIADRQTKKRK